MKKKVKILITIGIISMILGVMSDPSSVVLLGIGGGVFLTGMYILIYNI